MFKIIVVTPEKSHPQEEQILHALVRAYGITIHVRKPSYNTEEYRLYLSAYASILSHMVLHEHHALAKELSVKGIHLKERDRFSEEKTPPGVKVISTSLHVLEEASSIAYPYEYIFYSPLFKSISKENYGKDTSAEKLTATGAELKKSTHIPVIGLGGINEENIGLVKESGFDGAALLGAVWESDEPIEAFGKIIAKIK